MGFTSHFRVTSSSDLLDSRAVRNPLFRDYESEDSFEIDMQRVQICKEER
jgi:hypothetical protein